MSSHCDAFRAQLANWGWLPGEPLNWLECSVPDFSDIKYQTCCFMYACRNQQQCDCGWCFCGSQRVLLLSFVECCLSWLWINHQEVSEYRNCHFWWLQGQLQIFLAWKAWSFVPMHMVLTLRNSRLFLHSIFLKHYSEWGFRCENSRTCSTIHHWVHICDCSDLMFSLPSFTCTETKLCLLNICEEENSASILTKLWRFVFIFFLHC